MSLFCNNGPVSKAHMQQPSGLGQSHARRNKCISMSSNKLCALRNTRGQKQPFKIALIQNLIKGKTHDLCIRQIEMCFPRTFATHLPGNALDISQISIAIPHILSHAIQLTKYQLAIWKLPRKIAALRIHRIHGVDHLGLQFRHNKTVLNHHRTRNRLPAVLTPTIRIAQHASSIV